MDIPESITCIDCGQKAHLLSHPPEDGWNMGDIAAYRCSGCNDRWDLVVEDPGSATGENESSFAREWLRQRQVKKDPQ